MSQDNTASTASNDNTGSPATITLKNGMLVSNRRNLSKRQLKAFQMMCRNTHMNALTKDMQVHTWNKLHKDVRNNPHLVMLAIRSTPYFHPQSVANVTSENVVFRVQQYLLAKSITLKRKNSTGSNDVTNLFEYYAKHSRYLHANYRYECEHFLLHLAHENCGDGFTTWRNDYDISAIANDVRNQWESLRHVPSHISRIVSARLRERDERAASAPIVKPMKDRLQEEYARIYQTRPIHWANSLSSFQHRIASRVRPDGACVGIELEFVAGRASNIITWDEDDFPFQTWHTFKTDGSINPNTSDEATARYQEYTCFINADNPNDWSGVRNILAEMTSNGALVNNTCGNHVHIDMRHKSQATYYRIAGRMRDAFTTWAHRLVSHKRAYNRYCGIQNDHHNNRYTAINTACWNEHRTLEVRIGMPTLNYNKLYLWTQFLRYLADNYNRIETFDEFMSSDAPLQLKLYAIKRITKFEPTYTAAGKQALEGFEKWKQSLESVSGIDTDFTSVNFTDRI